MKVEYRSIDEEMAFAHVVLSKILKLNKNNKTNISSKIHFCHEKKS